VGPQLHSLHIQERACSAKPETYNLGQNYCCAVQCHHHPAAFTAEDDSKASHLVRSYPFFDGTHTNNPEELRVCELCQSVDFSGAEEQDRCDCGVALYMENLLEPSENDLLCGECHGNTGRRVTIKCN
jgi:hypothetical protein